MTSSRDLLLRLLDEGYEVRAWHGPNLRGALRGVNAREAAWRPAAGRHNIWELAVHAAYWKYVVRRKLTGERRGSFPLAGSNWFERPSSPTEKAWRQDRELLEAQHRLLREAVASISPDRLKIPQKGARRGVLRLITGAAFHDIYHAGQIQLLKALQRKKRRR